MKHVDSIYLTVVCLVTALALILSCSGEEITGSPDPPSTGLVGSWIEGDPMALRSAFDFQADSTYFYLFGGFDTATIGLMATAGAFSYVNDSLSLDNDGLIIRDLATLTNNAGRLVLSSGSAAQTFLRASLTSERRGGFTGDYLSTFRIAEPGGYNFTAGQQWVIPLHFEVVGTRLMVSFSLPSVGVLSPTEVHTWDPGDGAFNGYKFAAMGDFLGPAPDIGQKTALLSGSILPGNITATLRFVLYRGSTEAFKCIATGEKVMSN